MRFACHDLQLLVVVNIQITTEPDEPYKTLSKCVCYRRDSFTLDSTEMPQGAGSGIIWDDEGHVVTNLHVSCVLAWHVSLRQQRWAPVLAAGMLRVAQSGYSDLSCGLCRCQVVKDASDLQVCFACTCYGVACCDPSQSFALAYDIQ